MSVTRQQITDQLRKDNPSTTDDAGTRHGPGSPYYESMIETWADAMEAAQVVPPPATVTPRQIRLALLGIGITPPMIEAELAGDAAALVEWEYATFIARDHPLVAALAAALSLSPSQVDSLFLAAADL